MATVCSLCCALGLVACGGNNDGGDGDKLVLEINGKETTVLINSFNTVPEGEHFGRISVFSSDIEIKVKGTTTVKE